MYARDCKLLKVFAYIYTGQYIQVYKNEHVTFKAHSYMSITRIDRFTKPLDSQIGVFFL